MTALIGGMCVGLLCGLWAMRRIHKIGAKITMENERMTLRNVRLTKLLNEKTNGKETEKGQAEKAEGDGNPIG
jgi:hypothetical protein